MNSPGIYQSMWQEVNTVLVIETKNEKNEIKRPKLGENILWKCG